MSNDKLNPPYNDLIGDILKKHTADGGMDSLEGQGKPLSKEYLSGDTFQHFQRIAKDAGYKPHWLKLQHEIRDELILLVEIISPNPGKELERRLEKVNRKITEHNKSCPTPLQKGRVSIDNIGAVVDRWK